MTTGGVNRKTSVRENFCSQISSFLQDPILSLLFSDGNASCKSGEENFLDRIKHALAATEDPEIIETLLESAAEIMMADDVYSQLFLYSLILLVHQLDKIRLNVRTEASQLIHKCCCFHFKGGFEIFLSKAAHIRNELFDYISFSLASSPEMVKEFAEAVLGVEPEELLKKMMIPVVLPKLVVSQLDNNQAVDTLHELTKCLDPDVVALIVNWLSKVLAFALHQADEKDLLLSLQFYHAQTRSNNKEIFAAALPYFWLNLLERVPQMIKKAAGVLTNAEDLPGSLLNTYLPKLVVLLMRAIGNESLQSEGLSVLHYFIVQLAVVSPSSTKHKMVEILKELVLKNRVILKEHIHEFPLLPHIPALTEVNEAIQEARGTNELEESITRCCCWCESLESEYCLRALGAVDPAKLRNISCQRFKIQCSDDDLIFELIHKHLARAFRAAPDTGVQDYAALAIQELQKIAGCEASLDGNVASISQAKKDNEPLETIALGIKTSDSNSGNNSGVC
ncbi:hypothetical protein PTKIN_Ptkin02bG0254200 [Pterospermum kingtungense]